MKIPVAVILIGIALIFIGDLSSPAPDIKCRVDGGVMVTRPYEVEFSDGERGIANRWECAYPVEEDENP